VNQSKIMKKYLWIFCLLVSATTFAQNTHRLGDTHAPEKRAAQTVDQIVERVQFINDNQRDSLLIIFKYYYDDLITYRKSKRDNLIPVLVKLRDEQVTKLLSENQYKEYFKFMEEVRIEEQRKNAKTQKYGHKSM